jgi:hypothetical protein
MIASFFQSLETHRVAYLLISGQATVLYGAATFSEDIDAGNGTRSALTSRSRTFSIWKTSGSIEKLGGAK